MKEDSLPTTVITLDTDLEILEAYRTGKREQAVTAIVRRYQRYAYAVALRYVRTPEDAYDCAQEVMVKVVTSIERFRGDSTLQTWIARIARNTAVSMYHKNKLLSFFAIGEGPDEQDIQAHQLSPVDHAEQNEFETFFRTILAELPLKQRETFMMRYYDELSYEEISTIVGKSVGALKANYHWAVKKIAESLKGTEYYQQWMEVSK
ncbi:MAG: sigma-70 family RNA polymerase sigma factor [Bradyrhizobiaceae bacterium]|nr:sigma-70 family RNA polymerase sigma factor [Bradyrhizobiaceae bacterium]